MAKKFAMLFGIVFVIVGILGFIKNPIVGAGGYFETDLLHNLVHLVIGVLLLYGQGKGEAQAATFLKVVGIIYLLLAVLGFLMPGGKLIGLVAVNMADHWLHLVLGVIITAIGFSAKGSSMGSGMGTGMGGGMPPAPQA